MGEIRNSWCEPRSNTVRLEGHGARKRYLIFDARGNGKGGGITNYNW